MTIRHFPLSARLFAIACLALLTPGLGFASTLGCLVVPSTVVELGSPSVGVIQKIAVERGEAVKASQVLVSLKDEVERASFNLAATRAEADAELRAATQALEYASKKLDRTQDLYRQEFVSAQAVDQARVELQAARGRRLQAMEAVAQAKRELRVAAAQLETRTLRSPIDGVVLDIYRRPGERVEDRPILKLATLDPLHVELVLPASLYGQVKPGLKVSVTPDLPGVPVQTGTVSLADKVIDPASNTFRARLVLPNPHGDVPAGVRCKAQFPGIAPAGAAASVPARALP